MTDSAVQAAWDRVPAAVHFSEQALRESEETFRMAFECAPIGLAVVSLDGRCEFVNQAMCTLSGYSKAELMALTVAEVTHPDDLSGDAASMDQMLSGELTSYTTEKRYLTAGGEAVWVAKTLSLVRREDGSALNYIAQIQDITDRKADQAVLTEERRRLVAAQSIGHIGSWEMDVTTNVVTWSDTCLALYGIAAEDFTGDYAGIEVSIHPDDRQLVADALHACALTGVTLQIRHRAIRADDGELRWFDAFGTRQQDGSVVRIAGAVIDVTEHVLAEARLEHAALHDGLTGLPNRRLVADRLGQALTRAERQGQVVVLYCDLDGFKRVNDVHGHHAGDAVLVEAAARLVAASRGGDTVGRMGGDEFVIICSMAADGDPAKVGEMVAGRIERAMSAPIRVDGVEHRVSISSGICTADQGDDPDAILRNADLAMYMAKTQGKNGHCLFNGAMRAEALGRDDTERQIRHAVAEDAVEVYYQPIVEARTGRIRGVEALLRIPDGAGGHLNTLEAVKVAEQAGIIGDLDDRVLQLACAQVKTWRNRPEHRRLTITVNRSAADIARPGLYERVTGVVAAAGLDPHGLSIEITETVLLEAAPHTIGDLRRLRADGIGITIDDFGTGYASLSYLATLPISCLKVDQSFTAGLPKDQTCVTIVRATVGLAADLGMRCVVEGVERIDQLDALPDTPGLLAQGFLFSRPQPPSVDLPASLPPLRPVSSTSG